MLNKHAPTYTVEIDDSPEEPDTPRPIQRPNTLCLLLLGGRLVYIPLEDQW